MIRLELELKRPTTTTGKQELTATMQPDFLIRWRMHEMIVGEVKSILYGIIS